MKTIMPNDWLRRVALGTCMLSLLALSTGLASSSAQAQGQTVAFGFIFASFPSDFSSAKRHPLTFEDYLPAGEGKLTSVFYSLRGTGLLTVTASSGALTNETSSSKGINLEFQPVQFSLPYNTRSDVDGSFRILVIAKNEIREVADFEFPRVNVWSKEHIEAADQLFLAGRVLASLTTSAQSSDARSLISNATAKHASATSAFFAREWGTALKEAKETIALVRQAGQAEAFFTQLLRDRESVRVEKELAIKEKSNSLEEMRIELEQRRATLDEQRFQIEAREKSAALVTWYLASASLIFVIVAGSYAIFRLSRRTPRL